MSNGAIRIDTSNFNRMVKELSRLTGVNVNDVLEAEVQGILKRTRQKTVKASAKAIRAYYSSVTTASGDWRFIEFNGKKYCLGNHYPDSVWAKITAFRRGNMKEALARRGLSRQGWQRIGRQLDFPEFSSAYIKSNVASIVDHYVHGRKEQKGPKLVIRVDYGLSAGIKGAGAKWALESSIAGRRKYFSMNIKKGVFKKVATMAKKYPGMKIVGI